MNVRILFYQEENGSEPARDFISGLDAKMRAKVLRTLELLERNGSELRAPYSKHLKDGIFELHCQTGTNSSRILYFFFYNSSVILTNGFIKKTNKVPKGELERAFQYRERFLRQREQEDDTVQGIS